MAVTDYSITSDKNELHAKLITLLEIYGINQEEELLNSDILLTLLYKIHERVFLLEQLIETKSDKTSPNNNHTQETVKLTTETLKSPQMIDLPVELY